MHGMIKNWVIEFHMIAHIMRDMDIGDTCVIACGDIAIFGKCSWIGWWWGNLGDVGLFRRTLSNCVNCSQKIILIKSPAFRL